jgi:Reverse transcriptase (RNA-dependent DNA polymerase)
MFYMLGSVCGTLLFDIQGFFNNVNHARLVALVRALGFSVEICSWTSFFLQDRSVRLCFNNYTSESIDLELGTPQGSPILLSLSIIYTSELSSLTAPPRKEDDKVLRLIAHEVIGLMSNMQATIGLAGLHVWWLLGK